MMQQAVTRRFDQYLFLSEQTTGKDGRRVFINPDLLAPFLEFVREDSLRGKQSLANMIDLKNSAAGITSQSNQSNASQHRLDCGGVVVTYSVVQAGSPNSFGEGVYISNLQQSLNRGRGDSAGLYNSTFNLESWETKKSEDKKISNKICAVAANFSTEDQSYQLELTGNSVGDYLVKYTPGKHLGNEYSLYYSPTFIIDSLGTWKSPEQKIAVGKAGPDELAEILIETQQQYWSETDQKHHWYIFGHSAKLLKNALHKVQERGTVSLSHHEFSFVEPRSSLGPLLNQISQLRASFNQTLSMRAPGSRYHQATNAESTVSGLQAHNKSWSNLDQRLKPAANFLANAERVKDQIASNPSNIGNHTQNNFIELLNKLTKNLEWT